MRLIIVIQFTKNIDIINLKGEFQSWDAVLRARIVIKLIILSCIDDVLLLFRVWVVVAVSSNSVPSIDGTIDLLLLYGMIVF